MIQPSPEEAVTVFIISTRRPTPMYNQTREKEAL